MHLTPRCALLALVAAPIVLAFPAWSTFWAVLAGVLVLIALDTAWAGSTRTLELDRSGATRARLGDTATVRVRVSNRGRRTVKGALRDAWPPSAGASPDRQPLRVSAGQAVDLDTVLRPTRRGDRHPDRITVRSLGPLGLAGRQSMHRVPWTVRALPEFASRRHLPSRLARLREMEGRTPVMVRGAGTEFDTMRPYVVGDDVRSIDWRATARSNDVMVRTWRPERDRRIVIVLDTGRTAAARIGDAPRLDAALDAALLLATLAGRAGDHVTLLAHDTALRASVSGAEGANLLPAMVNALALVEPALVETDARALVAQVMATHRQRALVVLLTPLEPTGLREGLLPLMPSLVARHDVVLASVSDPRVDELLAAPQGFDVDSVFAAASAEKAVLDRTAVAGLLARSGVEVVDAPPETIAPALADRYLALKAAGRL
jgi:uncharacterized protein (DUF58 family)